MKNLIAFIKAQNKMYLTGTYLVMIGLFGLMPKFITLNFSIEPSDMHIQVTTLVALFGLLALSIGSLMVARFRNIYD